MSNQPTLFPIASATSLQASVDGQSPCDSPDGETTKKSGQDQPLVSRSAAQAKLTEFSTNGIYGQLFNASSPSAALQRSLENRLRARLVGCGSLGYALSWRELDMPSGQPLLVLRSSRSTTDRDSIGLLPTPPASEGHDWSRPEILARLDRGGRVARRICRLSSAARSHQGPLGLNHCFALAMMGFPAEWSDCLALAMQSCRNSRQSSSRRAPKPSKG